MGQKKRDFFGGNSPLTRIVGKKENDSFSLSFFFYIAL